MAARAFLAGIAVGVASAVAVPLVLLVAARQDPRVLARAAARAADVLGEKTRETFAELQETFEDFLAEVRDGEHPADATDAAVASEEATPHRTRERAQDRAA